MSNSRKDTWRQRKASFDGERDKSDEKLVKAKSLPDVALTEMTAQKDRLRDEFDRNFFGEEDAFYQGKKGSTKTIRCTGEGRFSDGESHNE